MDSLITDFGKAKAVLEVERDLEIEDMVSEVLPFYFLSE